jgi:HEAT repeat protein
MQCVSIFLKMLRHEADPEVLHSILIALGHLGEPESIKPASCFRWHHSPDVRYGVVQALTGHEDPLAIQSLIELSKDDDARVRDWATFGLGQQVDSDTPSLREALIERLTDSDEDARGEALIGLARRGDRRLIPALIDELESESVGMLAVESAELIADPQLYSSLVALRDWWDVNADLLEAAILACSPQERA